MNLNLQTAENYDNRDIVEISNWLTQLGIDWNGNISTLKVLDLRHKQLNDLPQSIGQLTNLTELLLNDNQLTTLPKSIGQLTNLQKLSLFENQLTTLPKSIEKLSNLKTLSLFDNRLTTLPESIGKLTALQKLSLFENKLTSLSASFGQLTNLRELSLHHNSLISLPESFGQLTNLKELSLHHNSLTSLPKLFGRLTKLSHMDLGGNPIASSFRLQRFLDERNAEIRRLLVNELDSEEICAELGAEAIDTWREYTLLKIQHFQPIITSYQFEYGGNSSPELTGYEPIALLKMTCPSTGHIHILRVPPEMESAEAAITWVNHGIHPDKFIVQT